MLPIEIIGILSIIMCMWALSFGACVLAIVLSPDGKLY
jgi:hypothetical protein